MGEGRSHILAMNSATRQSLGMGQYASIQPGPD
jgi:hypothetical protein